MDGEDEPGFEEVSHVDKMFAKHSLKEIQKQHPLFARGSEDKLMLRVSVILCLRQSPHISVEREPFASRGERLGFSF